jgi:hypothetical protein
MGKRVVRHQNCGIFCEAVVSHFQSLASGEKQKKKSMLKQQT